MTTDSDFLVTLQVDEDFDENDTKTVLKVLQELVDEGLGPIHGVARVDLPSSDDRLRVHAERQVRGLRANIRRMERERVGFATELVSEEILSARDWYHDFSRWMNNHAENYAGDEYADLEEATNAMRSDLADFMQESLDNWYRNSDFGTAFADRAVENLLDDVSWEDVADHYSEEMSELIHDYWRRG